ncbi:MAG TPA: hypothetical protein VD833_02075 [Vicinamibacterales bacterium]|nr:hypothetical protein [Vicinamibacterales bacterium]
MDVYLVPVGSNRYEPYCEVPDEPPDAGLDGTDTRGVFRRLRQRFRDMLAEAERERRRPAPAHADRSWLGRARTRTMRWVAESIAEQRLLWHLRRQSAACLHYPDDLQAEASLGLLRAQLGKDFDKHRFWLIIDSLGFIGSGALMLVPGPNVIAYYFAFRLVGHYLSLRGARQGLTGVRWSAQPSAPLSELRRALQLEPAVRVRQVEDVAERLRLEHLVSFFERTATTSP